MKLDLAKLPVAEIVMGFFVVVLAVTFWGAFNAVSSGNGNAAGASPSPAVSESPGASATPAPSGGGNLAIAMHDNSFDPKELTVKAGSKVTIDISNKGVAIHNMHIAGADNKFADSFCKPSGKEPCSDPNTVAGGTTATLTWQAPDTAGTVNFRCDFHPQEMTGTITVQ